jgi:hypothetical protein
VACGITIKGKKHLQDLLFCVFKPTKDKIHLQDLLMNNEQAVNVYENLNHGVPHSLQAAVAASATQS